MVSGKKEPNDLGWRLRVRVEQSRLVREVTVCETLLNLAIVNLRSSWAVVWPQPEPLWVYHSIGDAIEQTLLRLKQLSAWKLG